MDSPTSARTTSARARRPFRIRRFPVLALALASLTTSGTHAQLTATDVYEPGVEGEIWRFIGSLGASYGAACAEQGYDKNGNCFDFLAPGTDELWEPIGFDVWDDGTIANYRLYVADRFNWRVVVYDYFGQHVQTLDVFQGMNGVDDFFANPESLAVDAAGNIIVSDTSNQRIVVFNALFQYQFEIPMLPGVEPAVLALAPGTTVSAPDAASCATPGPVRIALSTWGYPGSDPPHDDKNQVLLYDDRFCRVGELGVANVSANQLPGSFFLPGAPAIGPGGEIYVAGYQENKIEVFVPDAGSPSGYTRTLGINTGEPGTTVVDASGRAVSLAGPYGLTIDRRGRLVIGDANNNRVAVFLQPWHPENTSGGTQWQFAFELVAGGNIAGSWLAMIREDRSGRWLASSVVHDLIYAFEIPALAVVQAQAEEVPGTASGDVLRVRGNVVVPIGRQALTNVVPTVEHDQLVPASNRASLGLPVGPYLAAPGANVFDPLYSGTPIADIAQLDPGHYAQVYWDFPLQSDGQAQFWISAHKVTGTTDDIVAEPKSAAAESVPGTCVAPVLNAPLFNRPRFQILDASSGQLIDVYGNPLDITLSADQSPEGVREIRVQYTEGPLNGQTGVLPGASGTLHLDLGFADSVIWALRYRAIAACGAPSDWHALRFKIDAEPPRLFFGPVSPNPSGVDPDGRPWHNASQVTMRVVASDDDTFGSNVVFPDFPGVTGNELLLPFTAEGIGQWTKVRVQDLVGNLFEESTVALGFINIDRSAPRLTLEPLSLPNAAGWYRTDVSFRALAQDVPSLSGVRTLTSPDGLTIVPGSTRHRVEGTILLAREGVGLTVSATTDDYATNSASATSAPVRIDKTPPAVGASPAPGTYGGQVAVSLSAVDAPPHEGITPSGVARIRYQLGSGAAQDYTGPITLTTAGAHALTFWAEDVAGNSSAPRSVVYSVNATPTALGASYATPEDITLNLSAPASDPENDSLVFTLVAAPVHGTLALDPANGTGVYTPHPEFHGSDSFTFRVADDYSTSGVATVSISVTPVNDAPVARDVAASTIETDPVTVVPVYHDVDTGDVLSVSLASSPLNGTAAFAGSAFTYTANPGFVGVDSFRYAVRDAAGASAMATVTITVAARNTPPVCAGAAASPALLWPPNHKPHVITIRGLADPDGDPVSIVVTRILQDEPTETVGDGHTPVDGGGLGSPSPWVRAERMGPEGGARYGNGRVYEIFFTATDAKGASCEGMVRVGVRHDQGRRDQPIDSGCRWDSTTGAFVSCAPGARPPELPRGQKPRGRDR